jgi:hypothetical protein
VIGAYHRCAAEAVRSLTVWWQNTWATGCWFISAIRAVLAEGIVQHGNPDGARQLIDEVIAQIERPEGAPSLR